ncbi:MAG: tripartite tricarboxylate transporter substrate binding protein [Burkholderiales bacterium]|nr:tripartite tricarboxylate transporter substrate binding protein [Burkholderiales bacterium]
MTIPRAAALAAVLVLGVSLARAQPYPAKQVRVILGFPPGDTVDILVRPLAQRLSESFGQPFVVENRPGATGLIANEAVARAAPDGYVLLGAPGSSLTSSPQMHARPPFDALRDFAPIAQIGAFGYVFIAHPGVPASNVRQLVALARAKPGFLTYGSPGIGSGFHLAGELFTSMAHVRMLHVPYKGGVAVLNDMLAGRIDLMFFSLAVTQPHIRAGKLRALGVTGVKRDPLLPEVPTVDESGLKGYEMTGWHGVLAPAGTPPAILDRLNSEIARLLQTAEMKQLWAQRGMGTPSVTRAGFAQVIKSDHEKYAKLIRSAGITPQ